ncbi:hypothetical protein C5F48_20270 [Cereibacter changlensis JA139]|uniref:DNA cytosine methyltransferase n=2 Tax=Cereibacter changlensis TaxID=402884 RepID=A0A2T4JQ76_9RHOB|nr:hypothetical protein [Cereibacter changlensis]PTE19927.1 hypothetical protein C5F48_20270 [Cereibacter changlensis JA139]PZX54227.1 hypothetical protein LX76_01870 [Cereibacter changlensis]
MAQALRVLVGCETSGRVRRAFAARGHDAWSCDLLPAEDGSNRHLVGDIRDMLHMGWDLLAVMHPPCTRLCNSGVRWLHEPPKHAPKEATDEERAAWPDLGRAARLAVMWRLLEEGASLFSACWGAPITRVAIENPVMHRHAAERLPADLPRPQIVQPWWFGEPFFKATGFYRRGLPPLTPTNRLTPPKPGTEEHKAWSAIHRASPGPDRWKIRSRTFAGVAEAIAEQWGGHAEREAAA